MQMQTRTFVLLALYRLSVGFDAPEAVNVPQSVFEDECDGLNPDACDVSLLQRRALQARSSEEEEMTEQDTPNDPPEEGDDEDDEGHTEDEEEGEEAADEATATAEMRQHPNSQAAQAKENATNATNVTLPEAPLHEFYVYRSMSYKEWPFGDVNVGNLEGVMWYLTNEVLPRCPKRYNITQIRRFKIKTQASPELFARNMNFGVRYSYDAGTCTGSNTIRMGPCSRTWDRFGYVVGCNWFGSHYPWPVMPSAYPGGIWYDLPMEGRCDSPTGAWNCTWSYEEAGSVLLEEELESKYHGPGYYCHRHQTKFWNNKPSRKSGRWRVRKVKEVFAAKYPDMPGDLPTPACDFNKHAFWA